MLEIWGPPANVIGKLFVVFLIARLAFQHHLLKKRVPSLCCAWPVIVQYEPRCTWQLLHVQALKKTAENFKVLIFPLFLITLFKTAICCLVCRSASTQKSC